MDKEVKITKLDNGYVLKVIDLDGDGRVPIEKYVAEDVEKISNLLKKIYEL